MRPLLFLLCLSARALTLGISLTWDPAETNLAGYRIHQGTNSGVYDQVTDVGNVTNYPVSNLTPGKPYYFVATAYTAEGIESHPSNEVSATVAAAIPPPIKLGVRIVIEDALWTNCASKINDLSIYMQSEGLDVSILRYDSRGRTTNSFGVVGFSGTIDGSSRSAKALAQTNIWPAITNGVKYFLFLGELPVAYAGLDQCPDGHGATFTWDGWRDSQNTAGAYPCTQFYSTPAPFGSNSSSWSDSAGAALSLNTGRMNAAGDGRFDNDFMPTTPRAAIGWVGGFGDQALDPNGVLRRSKVINDWIARDIAARTGQWPAAGAVYQFQVPSSDPHADGQFWLDLVSMYGTNAVSNGQTTVVGAALTNRPVAFKIVYGGADAWGNSWFGAKLPQFRSPNAIAVFLRQSYAFSIPGGNNWIARSIIDNPTNAPVCAMAWDQIPSRVGWDIKKLAVPGKRIGDMFIEAQPLSRSPSYPGLYGDPTLRLVAP